MHREADQVACPDPGRKQAAGLAVHRIPQRGIGQDGAVLLQRRPVRAAGGVGQHGVGQVHRDAPRGAAGPISRAIWSRSISLAPSPKV